MRIRIKFAKRGMMRFIGHLDIMRYFQKAIRRAGIDVAMSKGFSPHQLMSFAAPLGVGLTSEGEYMDIEVNSTGSSKEMLERLNVVMVEGMEVLTYGELPEGTKKAMASVAAADYLLSFDLARMPGFENMEDFYTRLSGFLDQESIVVLKKTKKSEIETDIRPMIYAFERRGNDLFLKLATGSEKNLKPELVMKSFSDALKMEFDPFCMAVKRLEIYAAKQDSEQLELIPLFEQAVNIE